MSELRTDDVTRDPSARSNSARDHTYEERRALGERMDEQRSIARVATEQEAREDHQRVQDQHEAREDYERELVARREEPSAHERMAQKAAAERSRNAWKEPPAGARADEKPAQTEGEARQRMTQRNREAWKGAAK